MISRKTHGLVSVLSLLLSVVWLFTGAVGAGSLGWRSGIALLLFVAIMMVMPLRRLLSRGLTQAHLKTHVSLGFTGPLLLITHIGSFGYGYTTWLYCLFVLVCATGGWVAWRPAATGKMRQRQQSLHALAAVTILPLVATHVWLALYYE